MGFDFHMIYAPHRSGSGCCCWCDWRMVAHAGKRNRTAFLFQDALLLDGINML